MEVKIPFDFGSARGNFNCHKHGDQDGGLVIKIDTYPDKPAVQRIFCAHCIIEAIERIAPLRTLQTPFTPPVD